MDMTRADWFATVLLAQYLGLFILYIWETNWPKAAYWGGAAIITGAVLWMP